MPRFDATEAIFFGFRLIRRDPTLVLGLAALLVVVTLGGDLATAGARGEFLAAQERLAEINAEAAPFAVLSELFAAYAGYFGAPQVLAYFLVFVLAWFACQGAVLRGLVREERRGWAGLQLGRDELQIAVAWIVVKAATWGMYFCGLFVASIVVGPLSAWSPALATLFILLAVMGMVLPALLIGARLCAAAPASVGEGGFAVAASWRLTRGRMWELAGAHVVLVFMLAPLKLVDVVISISAASAGSGEAAAMALRSPGHMALLGLGAAFNVIEILAWSGIGAYAYRALGQAAGCARARSIAADAAPAMA